MVYLFIYRLTHDTGFAPCVDNGLLSLACCKGGQIRNGRAVKTGLRYEIGSKHSGIDYDKDKVYVLGVYRGKFLYLARITEVITMTDYYISRSDGRLDDIYSFIDGNLVRNHNLRNENVHTDKDDRIRDVAGEYVLLSEDFIYLGKDAAYVEIVKEYAPPSRGRKIYDGTTAEKIIAECLKYKDDKIHIPNTPIRKRSCS